MEYLKFQKIRKRKQVFFKRINYLSAREKSGQRIIKEITGRRVQLVCDPALLLTKDEWEKEINKKRLIRDEYIFVISWEIICGTENLLKN